MTPAPAWTGKGKQRPGRRRQAAKKQRSSDETRAALDAAMNLYGLSSFKLFWDPSLDTKALLAWNGETAVLAFRGTASLTNAWSDLQVRPDDSLSRESGAGAAHSLCGVS